MDTASNLELTQSEDNEDLENQIQTRPTINPVHREYFSP